MSALTTRLAALDAWFARRTAWLHHPRAGAAALAPPPWHWCPCCSA